MNNKGNVCRDVQEIVVKSRRFCKTCRKLNFYQIRMFPTKSAYKKTGTMWYKVSS